MLAASLRRLRVSVLVALCAALVIASAPVMAISRGVFDGDGHPNVGAVLYDFTGDGAITGDEQLCTGTLIAPTVFLTAGHCLVGWEPGTVLNVSFESALLDANGPGTLIPSSSFAFDPGFYSSFRAAHDIGVIILDAGATSGITPAGLPPAGLLDDMKADGSLASTVIENVGYGVSAGHKRGPATFSYDGNRNVSLSPVSTLNKTWLKLSMNADSTGLGGVCFGDSGGPKFIQGEDFLVAITTGGDGQCRNLNYNYRLDTADARAFLSAYVALP